MRWLVVLLASICLSEAVLVQNLGGIGWSAHNDNKSIIVSSRVPGSIYSDLQGNRKIGAVYSDFNDVKTRWVAYENWTFERHFDVSADILAKKHIYLTAHGLDTIGTVTLNEHIIIAATNQFVRYTAPINGILKQKQNVLRVKFQSAPLAAKRKYEQTLKEKYSIPPQCVPDVQQGECHDNMLRKMQASFSWDWGPAFPTQGIWKPITIEAYDSFLLRDVTVETKPKGNDQWELKYTMHIEMFPVHSTGSLEVFLDGTLLSNSTFDSKSFSANDARLYATAKIPESFKIKPWFPNGMGEQKLYNLTIRMTPKGEETQSKTLKIGFRTIEVVQEKLASKTEAYSFYFRVNNVPFWAKGSNWIPAHALHEAITEGYIRDLLYSAKLANMNMLRIWGGGIYEDDALYEIADEFGIMLWQDMMFACALYPTDAQFLSSVETEIRQQIRRLQHHPSIAVWSGNNENEVAYVTHWWPETRGKHAQDLLHDYKTLYIETIMPIVEAEDSTRHFLPSSPSNGIMTPTNNYTSSDPQSPRFGDVHFYTTGDVWNWTMYPSAKFVSEFGFQSWASLHTMEGALEATDLKYPLDKAWVHREHSAGWLENMSNMIRQYLPHASAGNVSRLEDYIYTTQIFQAMAIKTETEFYRRNRAVKEDGTGHTMGALYWQLNDIWPTVSWASTEFGGKWKMLHYYAKNMFENTLVHAWEEDSEFRVAIIRDDHGAEETLKLHIDVFDWSSLKPVHQQQMDVLTKPFNVTLAFHQNAEQFVKASTCRDRRHCFVRVSLTQAGQVKSSNFHFLDWPKNAIGLAKPKLTIKSVHGPTADEHGQHSFDIELQTDRIAPFVWIDFPASTHYDGRFSDNGFIMANESVHLKLSTRYELTAEQVHSLLVVKSIANVE